MCTAGTLQFDKTFFFLWIGLSGLPSGPYGLCRGNTQSISDFICLQDSRLCGSRNIHDRILCLRRRKSELEIRTFLSRYPWINRQKYGGIEAPYSHQSKHLWNFSVCKDYRFLRYPFVFDVSVCWSLRKSVILKDWGL